MTGTSGDGELRLSDDERLHALNSISEHYAAGRLDVDEFYERTGSIASARTLDVVQPSFRDLPGGVPLRASGGAIDKVPFTVGDTAGIAAAAPVPSKSTESELASLLRRGKWIESLDWLILGLTLVSFLVLNNVVDWDYAWVVWPSLIVTLGLPRMILGFSDSDEEIYEELKESEDADRKQRLRQAAERIKELES
ncbi:DUF1707 SHOCT-like domain-containing protein [Prescottella subtropica]|uniref:DUF1707 SHOCT-like domain-containing protein n=1 Tax=Prescottella subtropica TaxID=2545757 RepID=UPI0010F79F60|nr:DUF1707 domain-containing protein [Prescottella subtropica]